MFNVYNMSASASKKLDCSKSLLELGSQKDSRIKIIVFCFIQNATNQNSKCFDPNKNKNCDGTDYNQNTIWLDAAWGCTVTCKRVSPASNIVTKAHLWMTQL